MTLLLDSDVIIQLLRDHTRTAVTVRQAATSAERLAVSVISTAEVYAGMRDYEATLTNGLFAELHQFPVTAAIAKRAGELKNLLSRKGRAVDLDDMLIAATALTHGCPLMTYNLKDFRGTEVVLYESEEK